MTVGHLSLYFFPESSDQQRVASKSRSFFSKIPLHDFPKPLALPTAQGCGMGGRAAPLASLHYPAVVAQRNES